MNITTSTLDSIATVLLEGRFDAHEAPAVRTILDELIDGASITLIIDLSSVQFIDSTALSELVRAMKRAREHGGDLTLAAPSDPVRVILELTALDQAFTIVDARAAV